MEIQSGEFSTQAVVEPQGRSLFKDSVKGPASFLPGTAFLAIDVDNTIVEIDPKIQGLRRQVHKLGGFILPHANGLREKEGAVKTIQNLWKNPFVIGGGIFTIRVLPIVLSTRLQMNCLGLENLENRHSPTHGKSDPAKVVKVMNDALGLQESELLSLDAQQAIDNASRIGEMILVDDNFGKVNAALNKLIAENDALAPLVGKFHLITFDEGELSTDTGMESGASLHTVHNWEEVPDAIDTILGDPKGRTVQISSLYRPDYK